MPGGRCAFWFRTNTALGDVVCRAGPFCLKSQMVNSS
jgi:hypothetical protein